jgi:hypothetical protein
MASNEMIITNEGLAQISNASAGGLLLQITKFRVGSGVTPPSPSDTDLAIPLLTLTTITSIEVVSDGAAKFTLTMNENLPGISADLTLNEVGIYTPSNVMFARGTFKSPIIKSPGIGIQLVVLVKTTQCDLSTIDISVGIETSLPSTPYVRNLPDPANSMHNVVAVMDLANNPASDHSGSLAIKYGAGGDMWGFVGYDLVYFGPVDASGLVTIPTEFKISSLSSRLTIANDEAFLVQAVSGLGSGQTRRCKFRASDAKFYEAENKPFSPPVTATLAGQTTVAVWMKTGSVGGALSGPVIPPLPTDHPDYVLTVGNSGIDPEWLPVSAGNGAKDSVSLYYPPSKLTFKSYSWTSSGKDTNFKVPSFAATSTTTQLPENICYTFVSVQGILQTRQAYELLKREYSVPPSGTVMYEVIVLFSEAPPFGSEVELWYAYRETGTSSRIIAKTFLSSKNLVQASDRKFHLTQDGNLSSPATDIPTDASELFVSVGGIKQFIGTYSYSAVASPAPFIEFTEAPPAGVEIEVTTLLSKDSTSGVNETTLFVNNDYFSYDNDITDIELSEVPTPATPGEAVNSYVFVNVSGIYLHRSKYNIIGNRVMFSSPIPKKRAISLTLVKNVLSTGSESSNINGLVVDGLMSSDYLYLLRHNSKPVRVPIPRLNLRSGKGISISGSYPYLTISTAATEASKKQRSPIKYNNLYSQDDVDEIIYTYRLSYTNSIVVMLTADFSARLGPGFNTKDGREYIEYAVGIRSGATREPAYGRKIKGTGESGFCYLGQDSDFAYANASISDSYEFLIEGGQGRYVDVVARMRVVNGNVSESHSFLSVNFNLLVFNVT